MKIMSEAKKKKMLDWFKRHPQKDKGRSKKAAMTKPWGRVFKVK